MMFVLNGAAAAVALRLRRLATRARFGPAPMTRSVALARIVLSGCAFLAIALPVRGEAQSRLHVPPLEDDLGYLGFSWIYGTGTMVIGSNSETPVRSGVYPTVSDVDKCSPAERAGLRVGDELTVVNGHDGRRMPLFADDPLEPGTVHVFTVRRGDELIELTMTSAEPLSQGEMPEDRCEVDEPPSG